MDPLMISTGVGAVAAVIAIAGYISRGKQIEELLEQSDSYFWQVVEQDRELRKFRAAETARRKTLSENGRKGRAAQLANAASKKAERAESAAKTLAAVAATPMRSRAQVVAPVKAKRTKMKSAAGMAAKQGG